jgi:hypothetical protein
VNITRLIFHEQAFNEMVRRPSGGIVRHLERRGEMVADIAQERLNVPWPPAASIPGPPHRRTGDLRASVHTQTLFDASGVAVFVVADAKHHGLDYPGILRERGYQFINEADLASVMSQG